jgi:DNA-binding transcriptional LysR family regulator
MRKGLQQIESIKQPGVGELRIGSSIVTDAGLLPAILQRFSQDFPHAVVHVVPENIAIQQYDNLRDRNVELVFGRLPATMTETWLRRRYLMNRMSSSQGPRAGGRSGET